MGINVKGGRGQMDPNSLRKRRAAAIWSDRFIGQDAQIHVALSVGRAAGVGAKKIDGLQGQSRRHCLEALLNRVTLIGKRRRQVFEKQPHILKLR